MMYTRNGAIVQILAMVAPGTDMDDAAQQNVQFSVECILCLLQMIYTRNRAICTATCDGGTRYRYGCRCWAKMYNTVYSVPLVYCR